VQFGVLQVFLVTQHVEHRHRAVLVQRILEVLERQVDEGAQLRHQLQVQAFLDGAHGVMPGQAIGGVGMGSTPEAVARNWSSSSISASAPRHCPANASRARSGEMLIQKQLAELRVERVVAGEPLAGPASFQNSTTCAATSITYSQPGAPRQAIIIIRRSAGGGPTCRCAG
jgi:hypothetical protein